MFKKEQLDLLETFITACKVNSNLLHTQELSFFKDWLLSLGAKVPEPLSEPPPKPKADKPTPKEDEEAEEMPDLEEEKEEEKIAVESEEDSDEEIESDLDIQDELDGIIYDEDSGELEMGDNTLDVTEEMIGESNSLRGEAMSYLSDGNLNAAIESFTEAIKKNPHSANMYAKRASVLIKAKRPSAALRDCEIALTINKDSAQPYKWRGRAYRILGKYVEAYHDFQTACRLDFDETSFEWQKEVEGNAKKIIEHNRKYERLHKEKEIKQKIKEAKRRKAEAEQEYERARKEEQNRPQCGFSGGMGGMPGGMGGMPGGDMPGAAGAGIPDLNTLFSDPEIMTAMQDPEIQAAFQDVSKNPGNMSKYENNPKIKKVIEKLQSKFRGSKMPDAPQ